jgi:hypothetical protein
MRTQSCSNRQLAPSLDNSPRNHDAEAGHRQEQRQSGKDRGCRGVEPAIGHRIPDDAINRRHVHHGN